MELEQLRQIEHQIDADIRDVFAKYGFKVTGRKATNHDSGIVKWNLTLADTNLKDKAGNATTPEAELYKAWAQLYGLPSDSIGRMFRSNGRTFTVVGLHQGRTNKIVAEQLGNLKRYLFHIDDVIRLLGREE